VGDGGISPEGVGGKGKDRQRAEEKEWQKHGSGGEIFHKKSAKKHVRRISEKPGRPGSGPSRAIGDGEFLRKKIIDNFRQIYQTAGQS
jgi:hypothetical protein